MKSSRVLTGAIIAGSVAVASMFAAAPASAATLPAGQKITVFDTTYDQFYNVNPATADSTPVGGPDALIPPYVTGIDVDDAGLGYAVANTMEVEETEDPEDFEPSFPTLGWIYKADANTGKLSDGKQVIVDTPGDINTVSNECAAVDYSKGVILAVCFSYGAETATTYIGTVDVSGADALLTPLTTLSTDDEDFVHFTAIAVNPVNGAIYGFDDDRPGSWTITLDDVDPVFLDYSDDYIVLGADFDRGGQLWLSVYGYSIPSLLANQSFFELATFDFASNQPVSVENFSSADPYTIDDPESITVWGVLAATGSTASPVAPAIAASLILLAGAILAAATLVLRRRSADA